MFLLGTYCLFITVWHLPALLVSLIGGFYRLELRQNQPGVFLVERGWWGGEVTEYRLMLRPYERVPGCGDLWMRRFEKPGVFQESPPRQVGAWESFSFTDEEPSSGPFRFDIWHER